MLEMMTIVSNENVFAFIIWSSLITASHEKNIHEIFRFCSTWPFLCTGYGVKALLVLGLIWLWGYRYIEFSDFSKCFLRLGRNPDALESNGLQIRFQRGKIHGNFIVAFFTQQFFFVSLCDRFTCCFRYCWSVSIFILTSWNYFPRNNMEDKQRA